MNKINEPNNKSQNFQQVDSTQVVEKIKTYKRPITNYYNGKYNGCLGDIHKRIIGKIGSISYYYPNWKLFPTNSAQCEELAIKWASSIESRPDFADKVVVIFFVMAKRFIQIEVKPRLTETKVIEQPQKIEEKFEQNINQKIEEKLEQNINQKLGAKVESKIETKFKEFVQEIRNEIIYEFKNEFEQEFKNMFEQEINNLKKEFKEEIATLKDEFKQFFKNLKEIPKQESKETKETKESKETKETKESKESKEK